jgi:hypothetical protein
MDDPNNPQLYRLPDGQKVTIESHEGDTAVVRRIDGPRADTRAICLAAKLEPIEGNE